MILKRNQVSIDNTFNTADIFPSDEAWEKAFAAASSLPDRLAEFRGRLSTDPHALLDYCRFGDEIELTIGALHAYAHLNADVDTANPTYREMLGRFMTFYAGLAAADAFSDPEIVSIDDATMDAFYREEPALENYRLALTRRRNQRGHILSDAEEKLLASAVEMAETASKAAGTFRDADLRFPDVIDAEGNSHKLTQGTYIALVKSPDRVLRKNAFETLYHTFGNFRHTLADLLDGQFRQLHFYAEARHYGSALTESLTRHEVPVSVYQNLIDTVRGRLDLMHRYVGIRKKAMGLHELHMYDLYTPLIAEADEKISYEDAKETVLKALSPLGEDYLSVVRRCFGERWIDVYENEGKRGGAYSSGARPHPYILLNHDDTLNSMFTLIHETGHAMHSYFSEKNQPVAYSDYVIFVAEVASTCNESLLMSYLLAHTEDRKKRAYLINYFLEQFRTTLYRQTMFAEFEKTVCEKVEQGETLTADELCRIYRQLNIDYYGADIVIDDEIDMEWARIPHFFYDFYVFQYATGFSAAMALSKKILTEGEEAVKRYLGFLSGGKSDTPINLLKKAGVNMEGPDAIRSALDTFASLLDEWEMLNAD